MDPENDLEPERFCNLVWYWLMRDRDEKERLKIETRLFMPPVGEEPTSGPWSAEGQMKAFQNVKAALMG